MTRYVKRTAISAGQGSSTTIAGNPIELVHNHVTAGGSEDPDRTAVTHINEPPVAAADSGPYLRQGGIPWHPSNTLLYFVVICA